MKKSFFYYLEIILTVIIGFCGLTLLIGGLCMSSPIAATLGAVGLGFSLIVPRL